MIPLSQSLSFFPVHSEEAHPFSIPFKREYDPQSGIQTFKVTWISKASTSQRSGRAGRTGPGHCYRLYSSSLFENYFEEFSPPEILQVPIEGVVLQMKSMGIDAVANFPFPTPPDRLALKKAESLLSHLGALQYDEDGKGMDRDKTKGKPSPSELVKRRIITVGGHITELGKAMALFPVNPRFAKMLVAGRQHDTLPYVVTIVAALSVGSPFLHENFIHDKDEGEEGDDGEKVFEDGEDAPAELGFIRDPELRAKETRKLERRKFYQSMQVRNLLFTRRLKIQRLTPHKLCLHTPYLQLHARLGKGVSDVFRMLSVVGAYEFAEGSAKFCVEHFVRRKVHWLSF